MNHKWNIYYNTLEAIRQGGAINMYGAASVLAKIENIDIDLAKKSPEKLDG